MITWKIRLLADIIGNAFDCECSLLKNDAVDFMIVAKLECLFSTKTARMASLTWHGDWLIQLLTNLFSMHLFPSNDGDLIVHEQLLIPVDHALSTNITGDAFDCECSRLKNASGLLWSLQSWNVCFLRNSRNIANSFDNLTLWLVNPVADRLIFASLFFPSNMMRTIGHPRKMVDSGGSYIYLRIS